MTRLEETVAALAAAGCVAAEEEACELLAATGDPELLQALIARRSRGEPLAWLVGSAPFCDIRVDVHPGVYVPRRQSEPLARRAAGLLPEGGVAVDLCTGSGAIARWLSERVPGATVVGTDVDRRAVANARANGVDARRGHLDRPLPVALLGTVDVIVAVVPYVPTPDLAYLPRDVLDHEPREALDGGAEGLGCLSAVVARSIGWLRPGGWLLLELGGDQAEPVGAQMAAAGFGDIAVLRDEEGDDRGIEGRRP